MTIEIALLLTAVSVVFAVYQGVCNLKRNKTIDDTKAATQLTTVIVKLENISQGISEIKSEVRTVKIDVENVRERVAILEQSIKRAHERIDAIEKKG